MRFDVYTAADFLGDDERRRMLDELRVADVAAATVSGRGEAYEVDSAARKTRALQPPPAVRARTLEKLMARETELERHFALEVETCEEPQFLRYEAGDYFVAHQDGNTPLIRDATLQRRISIVVFLNDARDYTGGQLVLHGRFPDTDARHTVDARAGSLIAFRSETTHEVLPVLSGERYTIAAWFRAG